MKSLDSPCGGDSGDTEVISVPPDLFVFSISIALHLSHVKEKNMKKKEENELRCSKHRRRRRACAFCFFCWIRNPQRFWLRSFSGSEEGSRVGLFSNHWKVSGRLWAHFWRPRMPRSNMSAPKLTPPTNLLFPLKMCIALVEEPWKSDGGRRI